MNDLTIAAQLRLAELKSQHEAACGIIATTKDRAVHARQTRRATQILQMMKAIIEGVPA